MRNIFIVFGIALVLIIGVVLFVTAVCEDDWCYVFPWQEQFVAQVNSFEECKNASYPIMESYPEQCRTPDGKTFTQDIGNELDKSDLIRVSNPRPNQMVMSPLTITGEARGTWYFEASFPVRVLDANSKELGIVPAQAQGEWMTTEFVPFKATLVFTKPATPTGTLVLEKDNPSGLPANADELRIPIRFTSGSVETGKCIATGCSGQICSDKDVVSTCEYTAAYACYKTAKCERQINNECGWTQTAELQRCIKSAQQEHSGVIGEVLLGPTCPVMRDPPDPQCADKPYQTKIDVFKKGGIGPIIATTESDSNGLFQLKLPPGEYTFVSKGGQTFPNCSPQDVTVIEGYVIDVTIFCDTGIR